MRIRRRGLFKPSERGLSQAVSFGKFANFRDFSIMVRIPDPTLMRHHASLL
jgi:hypothetical protein